MVKNENITQNDYKDIAELTSNYNVMKYVGDGKIYSSKKVKNFIKYCEIEVNQNDNNRTNYYYKIVDDDKFIGIIGFHLFQNNKDYYLSVYTDPKYQGKGYFSKALSLLLKKVAIHKPQISFIISLVYDKNEKMNAISENKFTFLKSITINGKKLNEYKIDIPKYNKKISSKKKQSSKLSSTKKTKKNSSHNIDYGRQSKELTIDEYKKLEYPYRNLEISKQEMLDDFKKLKQYKTKILRYNPTKKYINKFKNNKFLIFIEDYQQNEDLYRITDYFTEQCRVNCLLKIKTTKSRLEFFTKNKDEILE